MFMIVVQNENEHILIQNPQSQTLPAAFDKADKDAFVADCKEVIIISATIIIIIAKPKPRPSRIVGKDTVRRVHFGAFSTSHFAPSALSSDWIVLI